jgi:hypothetical protein
MCMCVCRVDLPDGSYTLTPNGDGVAAGELNQIGVQQDLDQSPEEPKASVCVESEEGKHREHSNPLYKLNSCHLLFSTLLL